MKKKLTDSDFYAQQIIRKQQDGKDYIFALVRRKYSDDDVESKGPGEYIGINRKESFAKITDNDPESDTYTERIEDINGAPIGIKMILLDEFNAKNIERYQKMEGITSYGQTQLIYMFRQINITADKSVEFWTVPQDDIYDRYVLKQQVIQIETNKLNDRQSNAKKVG